MNRKAESKKLRLKDFQGVPGLYLIGSEGQVYIGQTREVQTRRGQWREDEQLKVFAYPCSLRDRQEGELIGAEERVSTDVIETAEAIAILFFGEIACIANNSVGRDTEPFHPDWLRPGVGLAWMFASTIVGLVESRDIKLPDGSRLLPKKSGTNSDYFPLEESAATKPFVSEFGA